MTSSELTGRCLRLALTARTASDEVLLTEIVNLMQSKLTESSIVVIREGVVVTKWSLEGDEDDVQSASD